MAVECENHLGSLSPKDTAPMTRNKSGKVRLPVGFLPESNSVICGRGKACTTAVGNRRLRAIVEHHLSAYSEAKSKVEKSSIVSKIMETTKQGKACGCFVRYEDGAWWEVDESVAREKIGSLLRDCLHTQYRSSTKSKLARRKAKKIREENMIPFAGFSNPVLDLGCFPRLSEMFEHGNAAMPKAPLSSQMNNADPLNFESPCKPSFELSGSVHVGSAPKQYGSRQVNSVKNYYSTLSNYANQSLGLPQQEENIFASTSKTENSLTQFDAVRQAYSLVRDNGIPDDDFPDDLSDIFDD